MLPGNQTPIASMVCVPLIARGERVGVVTATSERTGAFDADHLELVRFIARTIALDIENVRLHRVAVTDPLTGAFNREFLVQRLPQEIAAARDRDRPLSLALVDVDHFKSVNDRYGHHVGDVVLTEVARRLRGAIRGRRSAGALRRRGVPRRAAPGRRRPGLGGRRADAAAGVRSARSTSATGSRCCCGCRSAWRSGARAS